jgi:hypothetical protein
MALPNVPHQTGRVNSGDVSIVYRKVQIVTVDAQHDVPDQAPDALIAQALLTGTAQAHRNNVRE